MFAYSMTQNMLIRQREKRVGRLGLPGEPGADALGLSGPSPVVPPGLDGHRLPGITVLARIGSFPASVSPDQAAARLVTGEAEASQEPPFAAGNDERVRRLRPSRRAQG